MANIYRIYPVLWEGHGCVSGQTVYAMDRPVSQIPTACSSRPKADPASTWEGNTFQRLLPPVGGGCWGNGIQAVTWATLPSWISYVQTLGYSISNNTALSDLKPYSDLYIVGP